VQRSSCHPPHSSEAEAADEDEDERAPAQAPADTEEEGAEQEGTHLLLVAPGSHTLAERYLASFGFPPLPSYEEGEEGRRFELGDPSDDANPCTISPPDATLGEGQGEGVNGGRGQKKRKGGIASIRLFVDPRPAEGVYAALGMGWAAGSASASPVGSPAVSPVASPVASPLASPTVPSFAAAMQASAAGHAHASPTVRL
jgi:hypothetical protein